MKISVRFLYQNYVILIQMYCTITYSSVILIHTFCNCLFYHMKVFAFPLILRSITREQIIVHSVQSVMYSLHIFPHNRMSTNISCEPFTLYSAKAKCRVLLGMLQKEGKSASLFEYSPSQEGKATLIVYISPCDSRLLILSEKEKRHLFPLSSQTTVNSRISSRTSFSPSEAKNYCNGIDL